MTTVTAVKQKIIPHLWFDTQAVEAATFYASVFPRSSVDHVTTIKDTPSGDCDVVDFTVFTHKFLSISAGPLFSFNPSISFIINFDPLFFDRDEKAARAALDSAWKKLTDGGKVLMPLDKYFFSPRYGWVQDKYGLSWQLILTNPDGEPRPPVIPSLMFAGEMAGKAEEAGKFYVSVFRNARPGAIYRYDGNMAPDKEGTAMYSDFMIEGGWISAMDSARQPEGVEFNEAVSLMVECESQDELDYYTNKLSAVPEAEQCGWIKDKYGLSWQIHPRELSDMMTRGTPEQVQRVTQSFLQMKRYDLAKLKKAFAG